MFLSADFWSAYSQLNDWTLDPVSFLLYTNITKTEMHSNRLSCFLKYIFISSLLEFYVMGCDLIYPPFLNFSQIHPHFPSCPVLCFFSQSRPICAAQTFLDVWFSNRVWSPDIDLEKQPFFS